jgi:hypothetical protein
MPAAGLFFFPDNSLFGWRLADHWLGDFYFG